MHNQQNLPAPRSRAHQRARGLSWDRDLQQRNRALFLTKSRATSLWGAQAKCGAKPDYLPLSSTSTASNGLSPTFVGV